MIKKEQIQNIVSIIPDALKTLSGFVKKSFEENGQDALENANGVAGVLVKLFGKEYIDQYFAQITKDKLKDFGSVIYLKASLLQAGNSIEAVFGEDYQNKNKVNIEQIKQKIEETIATFDAKNILTIFQPKYHPIVQFTKNTIRETLLSVGFENQEYNTFVKHFNENITGTIVSCFGEEDYKKHTDAVKKYLFNEREAEFLSDMFALRKIGFKEDEDLKYEETYGKFENITNLFPSEYVKLSQIEHEENKLSSVEELIEKYYSSKEKPTLREIVFIIADFGKGKSVFLRQYASKLAQNYVETVEGYFPVYFNLRNFASYQSGAKGGVIADFMRKDYGIDIFNIHEDQKRKYAFLIDSLDESGELNKYAIENVINSVQDIQSIDPVLFRENRIIITSRPFDDGLESQIKKHEPYSDENHHQYFISVHGFTKDQFNDWVRDSLKHYLNKKPIQTNSFTERIVASIQDDSYLVDIHKLLIENRTLTDEELKRPIFAYMIYQLIVNNVDFSTIGKTGVYLSFLNLLTKDAKHVNDVDCKFNLQDEIESRNILHAIAALWMYEKQQGKQGTLRKADIFRVLEGAKINDDDNRVLEENKGNNASNIKFLSHSYFGAKDDLLHFQHQSFAEMLLAEYYLKIFIKYALDDDVKSEDARVLLNLGEPTEQTVIFFKELLQLLKDSCLPNEIEKRKLLFPLMASLATEKHNKKMRCNRLYYTWLEQVPLSNSTFYPEKLIKDWCIDEGKIEKIIILAKTILESNKEYLTTKANFHTALFDREVVEIENERLNRAPHNIDKWLALLVGNILHTDIEKRLFFNGMINTPEVFFEMMKDWMYMYGIGTPNWAGGYFKGIITKNKNKKIDFKSIEMYDIDFSYSVLNDIEIKNCNIINCKFDFCEFAFVDIFAFIYRTTFDNIVNLKDSIVLLKNEILAVQLAQKFAPKDIGISFERRPFLTDEIYTTFTRGDKNRSHIDKNRLNDKLNVIRGFLAYGLKKRVFTVDEIIDAYEYNSDETKERFIQEVQALAKDIKAPVRKSRRLKKTKEVQAVDEE
ncbi:MAG: hypothetical protein A2552_07495 [Sulfuricurvum sp. RIFOXYD2_FULL_44_160]|uniref:NACHT domain-containing protein n=1 Tax=unclassified Sulfuricurvum TaxID=2632390 RepID=UPI0008AB215F|nr:MULTISPECIES: NACHT domain-containing protein [unclassified Sulfuricurvum]OHD91363.1 MAG: hypothetical protein A2517_10130 [Sulfuricurvum sp. RIFOXYD12_FULL_44_77]OHD92759.1 MAG: hypothetical protein A2552_07495 [Sulfuricurvum sp. RIFOXYD2_FULL_44_160]